MKTYILTLIVTFSILQSSSAQILGRVFDRATDKIADKISDEINEAIYREIEKATIRAVDKAMDDMLKEKYRSDSINGRTTSADYNSFLTAFLTPVDLPDNYTFDMVLVADVKDYDGEKSQIELMITKDGSLMGMKNVVDGENTYIIFDVENDIMAMYSIKDGKKQVTALPNMLTVGGSYVKANIDKKTKGAVMEKTSKTKKIEGYKCNLWNIEDDETKSKVYIAEDFPISWKESHSKFLDYMMPTTRKDEMPEGMALKSESKTKKKNKKSTFEVKEIIDSPTVFDNREYEQVSYQEQDD